MKKIILSLSLVLISLIPVLVHAQNGLRDRIAELASPAKGIVGVSVLGLEDRDTLNFHGNGRLVMMSVIKLPIAMAVLHLVDSGVMTLDETIKVKRKEYFDTQQSDLYTKYPDGGEITIRELLSFMISNSDNNACDILIKKLGGPEQVNYYLLKIAKIRGINIGATEEEMSKTWESQFTNWCKPVDMVKLLDLFYTGKLLLPDSRDFLYHIMAETVTGPQRIKGLLPAGTFVAHKTGSSGTQAGITPGTNDVGIITLPNGKHIAIAVFVCNSAADPATRDAVIAKIAKAVYDDEVSKG
jgi:beta-lactamase class A